MGLQLARKEDKLIDGLQTPCSKSPAKANDLEYDFYQNGTMKSEKRLELIWLPKP